ncbi:MAG: DUF481 domain-containing protein [Candidatus Latescibacterota bacterium]|nr:DUF481 domain-containing protein [Candidatus Latescibacterota bacterium]
MIFRVIVLLLLLWPTIGWSQIDIESRRQDGSTGLTCKIDLDLTARSGNVDLFEFGAGISLSFSQGRNTLILVASGDIGWEGGERFSNEALGHFRYVRFMLKRVQLESFLQSNYDLARSLDFRALGGLGLRFLLMQQDQSRAWLGVSFLLEHERNEVLAGYLHAEDTSDSRGSAYLSFRLRISETTDATGTFYYQPKLDDPDDFRVLIDYRLTVSVTRAVSLNTSVSLQHDSDPVDSVSESDFKLTTGLSIGW